MEEKFVILCCENIRPEVDAILATGTLPRASARSFPFHCGHVHSAWSSVKDQYDDLEAAGTTICLCGCGCSNTLDIPGEVRSNPSLVLVESGAPLFLPDTLVQEYQRGGAYLILPGWLLRWEQNAQHDGLDRATAREMFKESLSEIILLDTGVHSGIRPVLERFAEFTGLPARILPVGLDYFRFRLSALYLAWQCREEIASFKATVNIAEKKVADYSMVADLTDRLIGVHDEQEVIRQVLEIVVLLFDPKRAGFLPVKEERDGGIMSTPPGAYLSGEGFRDGFSPGSQYILMDSGDGFRFRVIYNENLIGILSVEQISIPSARDEYLNLTHFISRIAGLSITVARTHENLTLAVKARELEIAERIRAELALRESEENYRSIIENMQDLYYRTDPDGTITMASPEGVKLMGYSSPEDLIGRNISSLYIDHEELAKLNDMLKKKGSVYAFPIRIRDRLGLTRYVTTSSHYHHDTSGKIAGVEGIIHDITGRVRAEQALRESEERYRSVLDNMQDVFFRIDGDNIIDMTSESAAAVFGYNSAGELIGKPVTTLWMNPEKRAQFLSTLRTHGNAVQDYEAEFVKADGTPFWVSISARLNTDSAGNYAGTEGTIRDISERKKMEAALKSVLQKLNMLSSITRHDILNQITGLRTFLELSREDLQGTKFEAFIQKEDQAAEAIQRQIEFTKYYQDIGVNAPRWQDAGGVIREAIAQLSPQNIAIDANLPGIEIFADPLIVKVFFNLMENSLRHGERVTRMSFSAVETNTGLVITYEDDGVGISAEDKKKLFQRGFGKHTGLGLFLSREILAITGISIGETGEPGKGVRFELLVPGDVWRLAGSY